MTLVLLFGSNGNGFTKTLSRVGFQAAATVNPSTGEAEFAATNPSRMTFESFLNGIACEAVLVKAMAAMQK